MYVIRVQVYHACYNCTHMPLIDAVILGLVQGLTEFIPVSSSGHLIVVREIFNIGQTTGLEFDAVLQLATILAVFAYFFSDIMHLIKSAARLLLGKMVSVEDKRMLLAIMLGTIPAVCLGVFLEDEMGTIFRSADLVAGMLILGALLMVIAEKIGRQNASVSPRKGFEIGLFQSLALVPGVSRSGATISGGLLAGLTRAEAARFSFLLAFPIILGSGLKKLLEIGSGGELATLGPVLGVGFIVSFVVGLAAIHFLIRYLQHNSLMIFVWYRVLLAFGILFFIQ